MNDIKILAIGQLPKELGGNYTTGAANVLYELSKQGCMGCKLYVYATNANDKLLRKSCSYKNQYIGYTIDLTSIVIDLIRHPFASIREGVLYCKKCNYSALRGFFYKVNFKRAIRMVKPDVIHCHDFDKLVALRAAIGKMQIPIVLTCHGVFWNNNSSIYEMIKYNIKLADYVTGLTQDNYNAIRELGITESRISIIPNGVDSHKFAFSKQERASVRQALDISDSTIVFMTVASLQARKGQMSFVKLLKNVQFDYKYLIIGDGCDRQPIEEFVSENGMCDKVLLLGYKAANDLYKYYSAADIYAHVSTEEGQSLSEVEAYTTGLNILLNNKLCGTVVTEQKYPDYLIVDMDKFDYAALSQWIKNVGRERCQRGGLDWSVIFEKYCNLYRTIVEE